MAQRSQNGPRIQNSTDNAEKCGECEKFKHQAGQKCPVAGQKCKSCGKMGQFYKVCRSTKRQQGSQGSHRNVNNVQVTEDDTYRNEIGQIVQSPSLVQMIKVINKVRATEGSSEASKHLKFKCALHPSKSFQDHLSESGHSTGQGRNVYPSYPVHLVQSKCIKLTRS